MVLHQPPLNISVNRLGSPEKHLRAVYETDGMRRFYGQHNLVWRGSICGQEQVELSVSWVLGGPHA